MEKTTLSKRLKSYSALAGSVLGIAGAADATVIYTDIPDAVRTGNGGFYNLDLNNDVTVDYKISIVTGPSYAYVKIDRMNTNDMAGSMFDATTPAMSANAAIDQSLTWNMYNMNYLAIVSTMSTQGTWIGVTNKYLGLQLHVGPNIYYGWARLDVNSSATGFTIKDYAYNNVANQQILAGQTTVGVDELTSNPGVSISTFGNLAKVNFSDFQNTAATVVVTDMLGKDVMTIMVTEAQTELNLEFLNSGIYFIGVREEKYMTTKKVLVSK